MQFFFPPLNMILFQASTSKCSYDFHQLNVAFKFFLSKAGFFVERNSFVYLHFLSIFFLLNWPVSVIFYATDFTEDHSLVDSKHFQNFETSRGFLKWKFLISNWPNTYARYIFTSLYEFLLNVFIWERAQKYSTDILKFFKQLSDDIRIFIEWTNKFKEENISSITSNIF